MKPFGGVGEGGGEATRGLWDGAEAQQGNTHLPRAVGAVTLGLALQRSGVRGTRGQPGVPGLGPRWERVPWGPAEGGED